MKLALRCSNLFDMNTRTNHLDPSRWGTPVVLSTLLLVQCSSDRSPSSSESDIDGANATSAPASVNASQLNAEVNATYVEHAAATDRADSETSNMYTYTPAKERMMATNDMRGLRGLLLADLETVRARLNEGARPPASQEKDKALAADLAQGLERVDRALAALDASNDASWSSIREVQLKEVAEVRAWMADYRGSDAWAVK